MAELFLNLAGIPVQVTGEDFGSLTRLEEYITGPCAAEHRFRTVLADRLPRPQEPPEYSTGALRIYRRGAWVQRDMVTEADRVYIRTLRRGEDVVVEGLRDSMPRGITGRQLLHAMDLPHLLAVHNGFLLHASYIAHGGKAIVFTAPSGTGKSTQAKLWCDFAGAELINGDRAAIRLQQESVYAWGTPFSGSSPVRRNVTLPLGAIVYLSQAPQNSIRRLTGVRAFRRVWEGCTVNLWDRAETELVTDTLSRVIDRVPVFHLACTPDERAVALLKQTMEVNA